MFKYFRLCAALATLIGAISLVPLNSSANTSTSTSTSTSTNLFCVRASHYSASKRGVSLLVLKNGRVVYEEYYNGGSPERAYEIYSGTKSFMGIAAIAAQEDGLLDLDEKVSKTITEWKNDPARENISIRQLLQLTAGMQGGPGRPPTHQQAIENEIRGKPGQNFKYGPASFQVFAELLYRKLGEQETVAEYLERRIFKPIDLEVTGWRNGADGMPIASQGLRLTATNWAKFGQLILSKGMYKGEKVISQSSLKECFNGTKANPMYGLTWWMNKPIKPELRKTIVPLTASTDIEYGAPGIPDDLVMAAGAAGQRLYIVPSQQLVIVRQAKGLFASFLSGQKGKFSDMQFLSRLFTGKSSSLQNTDNKRGRHSSNLAKETSAKEIGANENGANENGANENGANENGANENGANENGANENGANENGANENGAGSLRRTRMKRLFAMFDRDGSGALEQSEKLELLKVMQRWRKRAQ